MTKLLLGKELAQAILLALEIPDRHVVSVVAKCKPNELATITIVRAVTQDDVQAAVQILNERKARPC